MRNQKSLLKVSLIASTMLLMVGCESRVENVQTKMNEIRNAQPLPIEPPPVFTPVPSYSYSSFGAKSPFVPTSIARELRVMAGKRVYPNLGRPTQPLEEYTLEELLMKGTMTSASGRIVALIQSPAGEIEKVQIGSYMGKNHGRIVAINPNQISLLEIVPDGQDGYIERPRTLILHGET